MLVCRDNTKNRPLLVEVASCYESGTWNLERPMREKAKTREASHRARKGHGPKTAPPLLRDCLWRLQGSVAVRVCLVLRSCRIREPSASSWTQRGCPTSEILVRWRLLSGMYGPPPDCV